jgi:hypothetical protein
LLNVWILRNHRHASQTHRNLLRDQHETYQTVVALRVHDSLLVLNHKPRRDHCTRKAAKHLAAQTHFWVRSLATASWDATAAVTTRVLRGPRRTHLQFSLRIRGALRAKHGVAAKRRIGARRVEHAYFPFIVIRLTRIRLITTLCLVTHKRTRSSVVGKPSTRSVWDW